jgi:hypothetical protein
MLCLACRVHTKVWHLSIFLQLALLYGLNLKAEISNVRFGQDAFIHSSQRIRAFRVRFGKLLSFFSVIELILVERIVTQVVRTYYRQFGITLS